MTASHQTRGRERKLVRLPNRFPGTRGAAAGQLRCSAPGTTSPDLEPPKTGEKAHASTGRGKAGCGHVQCPQEGTEDPGEPDRCKANTRMTSRTTKGEKKHRMHLEAPSAKRRTVYTARRNRSMQQRTRGQIFPVPCVRDRSGSLRGQGHCAAPRSYRENRESQAAEAARGCKDAAGREVGGFRVSRKGPHLWEPGRDWEAAPERAEPWDPRSPQAGSKDAPGRGEHPSSAPRIPGSPPLCLGSRAASRTVTDLRAGTRPPPQPRSGARGAALAALTSSRAPLVRRWAQAKPSAVIWGALPGRTGAAAQRK